MQLPSLHLVGDVGHHLMHCEGFPHKHKLQQASNKTSHPIFAMSLLRVTYSGSPIVTGLDLWIRTILGVPSQKDNHNNVAIQLLLHMKHLRFINLLVTDFFSNFSTPCI
jgi:hypothetical protein